MLVDGRPARVFGRDRADGIPREKFGSGGRKYLERALRESTCCGNPQLASSFESAGC